MQLSYNLMFLSMKAHIIKDQCLECWTFSRCFVTQPMFLHLDVSASEWSGIWTSQISHGPSHPMNLNRYGCSVIQVQNRSGGKTSRLNGCQDVIVPKRLATKFWICLFKGCQIWPCWQCGINVCILINTSPQKRRCRTSVRSATSAGWNNLWFSLIVSYLHLIILSNYWSLEKQGNWELVTNVNLPHLRLRHLIK